MEDGPEVWLQGIQPDLLDRQGWPARSAALAAPAGFADTDPVGGAVAGAGEAAVDEGFEQHGPDPVAAVPLVGQRSRGFRQQVGGPVGTLHPGQDQEPGVVGDAGQSGFPRRRIPADEVVPRCSLPSGPEA